MFSIERSLDFPGVARGWPLALVSRRSVRAMLPETPQNAPFAAFSGQMLVKGRRADFRPILTDFFMDRYG
jgi:hypothetical protein